MTTIKNATAQQSPILLEQLSHLMLNKSEMLQEKKTEWLKSRMAELKAQDMISTIKERREETEKETSIANEQWRSMFKENNGTLTPEMKKMRSECAIAKETIQEFDELLAVRQEEFTTLPWLTGKKAKDYIDMHNTLIASYAQVLFETFMQNHGGSLMQALSLHYLALRNITPTSLSNYGVYEGVNDADQLFKNFISDKITSLAMKYTPRVSNDRFLQQIGISPENEALWDLKKRPSPAATNKYYKNKKTSNKNNRK